MKTETAKPAMHCENAGHPLEWIVYSNGNAYQVRLWDSSIAGHPSCDCPDFNCRRRLAIKAGLPETECKHIEAVWDHFGRYAVRRIVALFINAQQNPRKWRNFWRLLFLLLTTDIFSNNNKASDRSNLKKI